MPRRGEFWLAHVIYKSEPRRGFPALIVAVDPSGSEVQVEICLPGHPIDNRRFWISPMWLLAEIATPSSR